MRPLTWRTSFFPTLIRKENQKQFAFTYNTQKYTLIVLPWGFVNSLSFCRNIICHVQNCLESLQTITLSCCIMLIKSDMQEGASTLEALLRHMGSRGWDINLMNDRSSSSSLKTVGSQRSRAPCQDTAAKVKGKLLHGTPLHGLENTTPGEPLWVLGAAYSTPGNTNLAHVLSDKKGCQLRVVTVEEMEAMY